MRYRTVALAAPAVLTALFALRAGADSPVGSDPAPMHFAHPLVTESPSPDTKVRADYRALDEPAAEVSTMLVEAEYAFSPSLSVLAAVPYSRRDPEAGSSETAFGSAEVAVKYANFALAERGFLLGGGLELGLPTGDSEAGIGSNEEVEIEPYLSAGLRTARTQTVARLAAGIPTNQPEAEDDAVDVEAVYELSFLYELTRRVQPLIEIDGETIVSGDQEESVTNVSPGVRWLPAGGSGVVLGLSVSVSVGDDDAFDQRLIGSFFFHF